jgi:Flp pilus assembly protein TadB
MMFQEQIEDRMNQYDHLSSLLIALGGAFVILALIVSSWVFLTIGAILIFPFAIGMYVLALRRYYKDSRQLKRKELQK